MLYRNTVFTSAKRLNHAFSRFVGNGNASVLPRISGVEHFNAYHGTSTVHEEKGTTKTERGLNRYGKKTSNFMRTKNLNRSSITGDRTSERRGIPGENRDAVKFPLDIKQDIADEKNKAKNRVALDDNILAGSGIKVFERNEFYPPAKKDMEVLEKPIYKLYMLYNAMDEELAWAQDIEDEVSEKEMHVNRLRRMDEWFSENVMRKLTNHVMLDGKKSKAETLIFKTVSQLKFEHDADFESVLSEAIFNVTPEMEVRHVRMGAQRYPVPFPLSSKRKLNMGLKWLVAAARNGNQNGFSNNFTHELLQASKNKGAAVKRCEDVHKLAFSGQAYTQFRW